MTMSQLCHAEPLGEESIYQCQNRFFGLRPQNDCFCFKFNKMQIERAERSWIIRVVVFFDFAPCFALPLHRKTPAYGLARLRPTKIRCLNHLAINVPMLVVFKSNVSTQIPKIYKQTQTERVEDPKKKAAHGGCQTWGGCKRCPFTFTNSLSPNKKFSLEKHVEYRSFI